MANTFSARTAKRVTRWIPVHLRLVDQSGTFVGEIADLSQTGARLLTDKPLFIGEQITISSAPGAVVRLGLIEARIVRQISPAPDGKKIEYGVSFLSLSQEEDAALSYIIKLTSNSKSFSLTRWSVLSGFFVGLPAILLLGNYGHPSLKNTALSMAAVALSLERILETFFTLKKDKGIQSSDDWSMSAVSFYYVWMILMASAEALLVRPVLTVGVCVLGSVLLVISFFLRWWGMHSLGPSWTIHVLRDFAPANLPPRITQQGPYRFMRHPIYTGVIMELLAIPLVFNAYWTLGVVVLINIPLQVLRGLLEEKQLLAEFGGAYAHFVSHRASFFPWKRKSSTDQDLRRIREVVIDFPDRRSEGVRKEREL
jgi:methyltransferase